MFGLVKFSLILGNKFIVDPDLEFIFPHIINVKLVNADFEMVKKFV